MEEIQMDVHVREQRGTQQSKKLRDQDFIPAIVYGGKSQPTPVKVSRADYEGIMRHHQGQSVVFHLNILDGDKKIADDTAILKDEQYGAISEQVLHIDFQRLTKGQKIEVTIPVRSGYEEPVGVTEEGGMLDQPIHEIDVYCLPKNIPEVIEVDVSQLAIGDAIHVADLKLPEGVEPHHDPESIIFTVVPPMREEEDEEKEDEPEEPEVLSEKKKSSAEEGESDQDSEEKNTSKSG